uniref:ATP synthase F0 subunit 8 n=1 Tax=Pseudogarypus banksi TaxID=1131925 RepID=H9MFI5_9ARAC|nr:ATP synthase F0 subunit 8 [Pseudogarypus banksi]
MPQIMPLNWIFYYMNFNLMFLLLIISYSSLKKLNLNNKLIFNHFNKFWMW